MILFFLKLNYFLGIFDGFSVLVSMLLGVFRDLKYFFMLFFLVICTFSMLLLILIPEAYTRYQSIFAWVIISVRSALGDHEFDDYNTQEDSYTKFFVAVIWLVIMIGGNVVFMNFMIAVVSESYQKCIQKQIIEMYKIRVRMILERERIMSPAEITRYYPPSLVLRKPEFSEMNN
jgi:hypothetical protein